MRFSLLALGLLTVSSGALACTYPLIDRIEGETSEAYSARLNGWIKDREVRLSREWQAARFDRAARVSLARVTASSGLLENEVGPDGVSKGPVFKSTALPLAALKGELRAVPVDLRHEPILTCAVFEKGSAAKAEVGALVVLFEEEGLGGLVLADGIRLDTVNDPRVKAALATLPPALREPRP